MKEIKDKHLFSLDDSQYSGDLLNTKVEDIKEPVILYGFIQDIDNAIDKWENPARYGQGDEVSMVKIGQLHPDACEYSGLTVKEAVCKRVKNQMIGSLLIDFVPVFCVASDIFRGYASKGDEYDTDFREYTRSEFTHLIKLEGENIDGISKKNIKTYWNAYKTGVVNRTGNFQMGTAQKKCSEKIISAYKSGKNVFLLGAKPRFGKNFTILETAKIMGWKKILFVSYLPTVFPSLKEDVMSHIDFDGWKYVDYRDKRNRGENPFDGETPTVVSVSAQLLNYADDEDGLKRSFTIEEMNDFRMTLNTLIKSGIDVIVPDEAHQGGLTVYMNNIISQANAKMTIYVTGTDSNFKSDPRFNSENTFEYDYIDEYLDTDSRAKKMPKIKIYTFEMDQRIRNAAKEYHIYEYPTFRKMFETRKNKFVYENLVREFFKAVFGKYNSTDGSLRTTIKLNNASPFKMDINIDHTLAILPTIDAVKASIKLLKKMGFDEDFEFINAAGNDGEKNIDNVKAKIQTNKHNHKKTVTFVCRRFREGVTVPAWHGVFLFDDGKSFNEYLQTMFRTQSPEQNKDFCYIFDYNPERCLQIRYDHINYNKKDGYTKEEMAKVLFDCMPISYYDAEGNLIEDDEFQNKLFEATHKKGFGDGFEEFGNSHLRISRWYYTDVKDMEERFQDVELNGGNTSTVNGRTNGLKGGKLNKVMGEIKKAISSGKSTSIKKEINNLIKLCVEVMKSVPEFLFVTGKHYTNIYSALKNENADVFKEITDFEMSDFIYLLDNGYIDVDALNYSIKKFYQDKVDNFDLAIMYAEDPSQSKDVESCIEKFYKKWLYEKGSNRDVPFSVLNTYNF